MISTISCWSDHFLTCGSTYRALKLPLQLVPRKLLFLHQLLKHFQSQTLTVALRRVLLVIVLLLMLLKSCQSLFVGRSPFHLSPPFRGCSTYFRLIFPKQVILHYYVFSVSFYEITGSHALLPHQVFTTGSRLVMASVCSRSKF